MGNACSILSDGVLMMYLLSPLSAIRASADHSQEDGPLRYISEPRWMRYNLGKSRMTRCLGFRYSVGQ